MLIAMPAGADDAQLFVQARPWIEACSVNGATVFNLLPSRPQRQNQHRNALGDADGADLSLRLTSTQAKVHDALLDALLGTSTCIVLTGAAGLGKTTILTAALSCIDQPERQVLWLDDGQDGMEKAFQTLFTSERPRTQRRQRRDHRLVLVMDQVETRLSGSFAYLELLSRMPGKAAPIQWVFVGRSEPWDCVDAAAAAWLREASPVCLTLPALSEQDAWELFQYRVSSTSGSRSAAKLVAALLRQSGGLPGRLDAALRAAIAAGLLQGPVQAS